VGLYIRVTLGLGSDLSATAMVYRRPRMIRRHEPRGLGFGLRVDLLVDADVVARASTPTQHGPDTNAAINSLLQVGLDAEEA